MNDPIETFELSGKTVKLYQEDHPESPRDWDNLGHIVCWHRRYNLGDEQVRPGEHPSFIEDFEQWLRKERGAFIVLPIYIYDHGSITVTARYETYLTYPDKQWDAGQVGFVYITKEKILEEYGVEYVSKETVDKVTEYLSCEVDSYDQYLTGDVWGYVIEDEEGEMVDSCWGFYGLHYARAEATEAVQGGPRAAAKTILGGAQCPQEQ